ncbi:chromosomal replication initiator protein DnaA [Candidatus Margulisiibacteriota bacterium]
MQNIWNKIDTLLKTELSSSGYQTFHSSAKPISYESNMLTLEVPNSFSKEWVKEKCEGLISNYFLKNENTTLMLNYIISKETYNSEDEQLSFLQKPSLKAQHNAKDLSYYNPKYTFENFVAGHNNRFAYAASLAVSKAPAKAYNPLFLYGAVGLGKTHLLNAIGMRVQELHPSLKVKFVSSEKFTNELINSIKDKKTDAFRSRYRSVDILLVDDIQFLAGKEQTQEEFFHTFNDLYTNNKQIIIASDRPPKEIPTLEVRLRTRFEWGLIADIQPPEFETRIAILRKKIEINNLNISDEILHYIATQIPNNVREMEGALTRIVAYAALLNTDVTLSIASNVIKDLVGFKNEKPLTISYIKRKVCDYFHISNSDLCSKGRSRDVVYSRQVAMYLARELTNVSLPKIGENFGNRDHTTVMHACDKIKNLLLTDTETKNIIHVLISNIKEMDQAQ